MKKVQAYMAIRGSGNANENADVPSDRMALYSKTIRPVLNYRVNKTKWVVLRWPTPSMAQAAGMSTEAFENLYFDVCTMDYPKMGRAMMPLERRMREADKVHIKGPGTGAGLRRVRQQQSLRRSLGHGPHSTARMGRRRNLVRPRVDPQKRQVRPEGFARAQS